MTDQNAAWESNKFIYYPKSAHFDVFLGQLISLSKYNRPELMSSKEGPSTEDDSYMGYSVETITLYGSSGPSASNISGAVVGTPRGDMLHGKVCCCLLDQLVRLRIIIENWVFLNCFFALFCFRIIEIIGCFRNHYQTFPKSMLRIDCDYCNACSSAP